MRQLTQNLKNGVLNLDEVPTPKVLPGMVLVKNHYSVISAGTEKSKIDVGKKSLIGKAKARPDQLAKVLANIKKEGLLKTWEVVKNKLETLQPLGYSSAGEVVAIGQYVDDINVGDMVACAGAGYANHAEYVAIPQNLVVKAGEVPLQLAAFTTIGAIALQGLRQADVKLGERVLIIGLGLLGQISVQLCKANGAYVLGIDLDESKCRLAETLGADKAMLSDADNVREYIRRLTSDNGIDKVIITAGTSSNGPIELAGEVAREKGCVVVVGAVSMNIPREPYFRKEIDIRISKSYGPGRYDPFYEEHGIDYPFGYVRFTERRNMDAFLYLLQQKKLNLEALITHTFSFQDAVKAYALIEGEQKEPYLGIVLEYPKENAANTEDKILLKAPIRPEAQLHISCIGAGNYAQKELLSKLAKDKRVQFKGLCTATGISAKSTADKFHFTFCTGKEEDIMNDPHTNLVMITTRHDTHADYVIRALTAEKHVFVEKPLALNEDELIRIENTYAASQHHVFVGFNRRFSPYTLKVKEHFKNLESQLVVHIRVNAGAIPKTHWIQDPVVGGGRIIGEACHFVDLAVALTGSTVNSVCTAGLPTDNALLNDNITIQLKMKNGAIANILYTSSGHSALPKEYIEVFGGGKTAVIDDFKRVILHGAKTATFKFGGQDKGQKAELERMIQVMLGDEKTFIPFEELANVTRTTFKIVESLHQGGEIKV